MKSNLTPREQAEQLFAKKRERAEKISENLQNNPLPKKIEPEHDAPSLHSYNNFGAPVSEVNKKQERLNALFATLNEEQKDIINDAFEIALDYDQNIDWL